MVDSYFATAVIIGILVVFGILVPIMNVKWRDYVSFRWICVVVILALLVGVVIDFKDLNDEARKCVLIGGLLIVGGYVILRTVEKIAFSSQSFRLQLKHGNSEANLALGDKTDAVRERDNHESGIGEAGASRRE